MADLTVLSSLPPVPVYPSFSRPTFSTYNLVEASGSRSRLSSFSSEARRSRPMLARLDLDARDEDERRSSSRSVSRGRTPPRSPSLHRELSISTDPGVVHGHGHSISDTLTDSPESETPSPEDGYEIAIPTISVTVETPQPSPKVFDGQWRPRHRHTRSQSAPPEGRTRLGGGPDNNEAGLLSPSSAIAIHARMNARGSAPNTARYGYGHGHAMGSRINLLHGMGSRSYNSSPFNSPTSSRSTFGFGSRELVKPPPPLRQYPIFSLFFSYSILPLVDRPTTFWRKTQRSGVTSSSYSPSTHLIRRSTFVAAGLPFEKPVYDVSAQSVESRIVYELPSSTAGKLNEVFWEVIV
jgi:hypothetical protein